MPPTPLCEYEIDLVNKYLPPELAKFGDRYPAPTINAVDAMTGELPGLASYKDYTPKRVEIHFGDLETRETSQPNLIFKNGELTHVYLPDYCKNSPVFAIEVDDDWAYIEVEGHILLNKIDGMNLPMIPSDRLEASLLSGYELFAVKANIDLLN